MEQPTIRCAHCKERHMTVAEVRACSEPRPADDVHVPEFMADGGVWR